MDASAIRMHMSPNGLLLRQSPFGSRFFCELKDNFIGAGASGTVYRCDTNRIPRITTNADGKIDCVCEGAGSVTYRACSLVL